MRRSSWIATIVLAVLCAIALVTSLGAIASAQASNSEANGRVLRFDILFRPFEENYVDVGSPGPGIGDMLVFQDQILDRQGRQVGFEAGTCTITAVIDTGFQTHCVGTVSLPGRTDRLPGTGDKCAGEGDGDRRGYREISDRGR